MNPNVLDEIRFILDSSFSIQEYPPIRRIYALLDKNTSPDVEAEDRGFQKALDIISIKLLDGTENNRIRAEAVASAKEIWEDIKKFRKEKQEFLKKARSPW